MADVLLKHSKNTNQDKENQSFSDAVLEHMKTKGIKQSELVADSLLSKTTISRILRNCNDKGSKYKPTLPIIMAVAIGLKLSYVEYEELIYFAFPSQKHMKTILDKKMSIYDANFHLNENQISSLGNLEE